MKRRHLVVIGQAVLPRLERVTALQFARIAASLQQHHVESGLGQTRRNSTATRAGTNHNIVAGIGGPGRLPAACVAQNVLRNSISASLSASVRPGSSSNWSVPK